MVEGWDERMDTDGRNGREVGKDQVDVKGKDGGMVKDRTGRVDVEMEDSGTERDKEKDRIGEARVRLQNPRCSLDLGDAPYVI